MAAYVSLNLNAFIAASPAVIVSELQTKYAKDGFSTQYTTQTRSWDISIPLLQRELQYLADMYFGVLPWKVLLELPLYRLRKRIDAVLITPSAVVVIELKVGEHAFRSGDKRQVEEYALDLRDFHEHSSNIMLVPVLWYTSSATSKHLPFDSSKGVCEVVEIGEKGLSDFLYKEILQNNNTANNVTPDWELGAYRPVPSVINAATTLFSGHGVKEIAQADATNLDLSARKILQIIEQTKSSNGRALVFLSGVPGSGKTLAGLQIVHSAIETGVEDRGDIVYLSGNTPLVVVLREALARDEYARKKARLEKASLDASRKYVCSRIQHIIDFLREYLSNDLQSAPHEHVIVFDEAQRAWDESYGREKFNRPASEPSLLLEIMGRHEDWSLIVALVGGGQEINKGENGIAEWGNAVRLLPQEYLERLTVYGSPGFVSGTEGTAYLGLGEIPSHARLKTDPALELSVPLRTFRSPNLSQWVAAVLKGDSMAAREVANALGDYPLLLTRSLKVAKKWLTNIARGERRYGLVASSGARRLRPEGLGVTLNATEGIAIAQWYLNEIGDVRSSYALEVPANEYTSQGLELDFICLCWDGDLTWGSGEWLYRKFMGNKWNKVNNEGARFIQNSYRVLLTRAREGLVIWVPTGTEDDHTRTPRFYDLTASFLRECGVRLID